MPGDRCSVVLVEEAISEISVVDLSIAEQSSAPGQDVLEGSLSAEEQRTVLEEESAKTDAESARTAVVKAPSAVKMDESKPPSYWEKVGNTLGGLSSMLNVRVPS